VQVAPQPAGLLAGGPELVREPDRGRHRAELGAQVVEQPALGAGPRLVGRALLHDQRADRGAAVGQR
jgi:hypothetical protein